MPPAARPAAPQLSRLGYLVPEFPSQTHAFFWRELQALREAGADVRLLSTRKPAPGACRHDFAEGARAETAYLFPPRWAGAIARLALHPLRTLAGLIYICSLSETPFSKRLRLLPALAPAAELVRRAQEEKLGHVHVHSCANAAHVVALSHRLGGPSYSLTLHGDLPVYGSDHDKKMERAAFVSAVTRPLQIQVMEATHLSPEHVPVITMGVDIDRFQPRESDTGAPSPFLIATVARLNETKGHIYALRALRRVLDTLGESADLRYHIAGDGPNCSAIESEIERLKLGSHVTLLGNLSENQVRELLGSCDLFCLPSFGLGEAAPVAVMEAMACGIPVACSIIGGTRDMIADGEDGFLIEQKDEEGLAAVFQRLYEEPETRARIARAARERATRDFDYRIVARRLLVYLEDAMATNSRSSRG